VDPRVPVAPAGLEQQDPQGGVRAQPVGEHAACRTRPDDDDIRLVVDMCPSLNRFGKKT
jgi:hypothetical protein